MAGRNIKLMVVGIRNVGKSSLINRLSGRKAQKTEDRPGVTRNKSWTVLPSGFALMDMPGLLWPKFEDEHVALHWRLPAHPRHGDRRRDVASRLLELLSKLYPSLLKDRYRLTDGYLATDIPLNFSKFSEKSAAFCFPAVKSTPTGVRRLSRRIPGRENRPHYLENRLKRSSSSCKIAADEH
jgi:ribosome biogenesis GTPase A